MSTRLQVVDEAELVSARPTLRARDANRVVMMERHGFAEILIYDRHFDGVPGVARTA